jgi:Tol biopolymer transport system component
MSRVIGLCGLATLLLAPSIEAQEVVFSRRVYAARGTTFQQLWTWSASDGRLTQLTRSARDHRNPVCSPDGTQISFYSATSRWSFDRKTGIEEPLNGAPPRAGIGTPDTSTLRVPGCDDRTWAPAPGGSRAVCTADGETLVIVDLSSGNEVERIRFDQRYPTGEPYPPWALQSTWSPDGHTLLVGTYGGSSTAPALDFFLLDLSTKTWTRAMTGNSAVWLPKGDAIIYETPRDLMPLPLSATHRVWSAHLVRFDVATGTETPLTSGVTNDIQPTLCGR